MKRNERSSSFRSFCALRLCPGSAPRTVILALLCLSAATTTATGTERVVVAWDQAPTGPSFVQAIGADSPWPYATAALAADLQAVVHVSEGRVYHLSRTTGRLRVIDAETWTVAQTFDFGQAVEVRDLLVIDPQTAYLTRKSHTHLARVDLTTGAVTDVVDLGGFADSDGFPEMNRMIRHEGRLFVQLRRVDFSPEPRPKLPPLLAVVDLATELLVDVDPGTPGVQAIELVGTEPRFAMQVVPSTRRLLVSATGNFHDRGGIEMIDLDTLQSLGLVIAEVDGEVGADLGAFVMVDADAGYLTFSTDLLLSSHLHRFTLSGGVDPVELHFALEYFVPRLLLDGSREKLFWPEPDGVHVFDAATGQRLTASPVAVNGDPTDLALVPNPTPVPGLSAWALGLLAAGLTGSAGLRRSGIGR